MRLGRGLEPVLGSTTRLSLLRTMFASPDSTRTGREIAAAARVSTAQAARDLAGLADVGILLRSVNGKSYSWRLNSRHVLYPTLSTLFRREAALREDLIAEVRQGLGTSPIEHASIFGSIARGEERPDSDLDLFVQVRKASDLPLAEDAIDRVRERVWNRFGNPVSSLVYTRAEAKRPANPGLMESIAREGIEVSPGSD